MLVVAFDWNMLDVTMLVIAEGISSRRRTYRRDVTYHAVDHLIVIALAVKAVNVSGSAQQQAEGHLLMTLAATTRDDNVNINT